MSKFYSNHIAVNTLRLVSHRSGYHFLFMRYRSRNNVEKHRLTRHDSTELYEIVFGKMSAEILISKISDPLQ